MVVVAFAVLIFFMMAAASVGGKIFRWAGWGFESTAECLLGSVGLGLAVIALAVFLLGISGVLFQEILVSFLVLCVALCWKEAVKVARGVWDLGRSLSTAGFSRQESWIGAVLLAVVVLNALISVAPLTGSDPMSYHFALPKLYAKTGSIDPILWHTASFFLGLPHMLILSGMVLGADQVALALNFGGGLLSLLSLLYVASRLLPRRCALLTGLIYAVTPMVYWEATSGHIDLWTVFYGLLAVNAMLRWMEDRSGGWLVTSGLFAGCAGSTKYVGWVIAAGLLLLVTVMTGIRGRGKMSPVWRAAVTFGLVAGLAGSWPHIRNWLWTGDPFFPLLAKLVSPLEAKTEHVASVPGSSLSVVGILLFPVRMILSGEEYGGSELFGPIVLALVPLLVVVGLKGDMRWRFLLVFCVLLFTGSAVTNQIPRYLIPIFPLLLLLVMEGLLMVWERRLMRLTGVGVVAAFTLFGVVSNTVYALDFLPVVVGLEGREAFLNRKAAEYPIAKFINDILPEEAKALVSINHVYYLERNYIIKSRNLWRIIDPVVAEKGGQGLRKELRRLGVTHVVKNERPSGGVPDAFDTLELCCLEEVARMEARVPDLARRLGRMQTLTITIYRLADRPDA